MLNHREFVAQKLNEYAELGYQLGDKSTGLRWEKAHFPKPDCLGGTEWVWLLHDDHMHQGILQSEEYQCQCFYPYLTFEWLDTFPQDGIELGELAWKWFIEHQKKASAKGVETNRAQQTGFYNKQMQINGGLATRDLGVGFHDPKVHKRGRQTQKELGVGFHDRELMAQVHEDLKARAVGFYDPEVQRRAKTNGAKATVAQKWISLVSGLISHSGGISLNHKKHGIPGKSRRLLLTPKQHDEIKDLQPIQRLLSIAMDDTDG